MSRVLITRAAGSWPALAARFEGSSIALQMTETATQVAPLDPAPGDRALARLDRYGWIVATSPRGVDALVARLAARGGTSLPSGVRVAAVGAATAKALLALSASVDLVAAEASTSGLAASLAPRMTAGERVLVIRPEGGPGALAGALRAAGAEVDEAPLYRTVASEHASRLADEAIAGAFAAVVFTAPSSLDRWLDAGGARRAALTAALARVARVAIGPTTAERLASAGLPAHAVAETPYEDAIADAIAAVLSA